MSATTATVLVVEPDRSVRDQISATVEGAGFDVLTCPGPTSPEYACPGVAGTGCPLASYADVVVMDLALDSDLTMEGTTAVELIAFYLGEGKAIIALSRDGGEETHPFVEERVTVLHWPLERRRLIPELREVAPQKWLGQGPSARKHVGPGSART